MTRLLEAPKVLGKRAKTCSAQSFPITFGLFIKGPVLENRESNIPV